MAPIGAVPSAITPSGFRLRASAIDEVVKELKRLRHQLRDLFGSQPKTTEHERRSVHLEVDLIVCTLHQKLAKVGVEKSPCFGLVLTLDDEHAREGFVLVEVDVLAAQ